MDIKISISVSLIDIKKMYHNIEIQGEYTLTNLKKSLEIIGTEDFRPYSTEWLCLKYTYPKDNYTNFRCFVNLKNGIL